MFSSSQAEAAKAPIEIQTFVYMLDLREIDGARQNFSADVFVRLRWKDPMLESSEGARVLPINTAWNPGIQIVNRITVQTTLPEVLEVDKDGNVIYRQRFIGQFSSLLDLREFPFDRQTLSISMAAPGKSPEEVRFVQDPERGGLGNKITITDWEIGEWRAGEQPYQTTPRGRSIAGFVFEMDTTRRVQYFLVQILLPMTLILGMSWIVFWLDYSQTGPRISISITSMLTLVAYRLLTGSFLPRLSYLTRLDYFVFGCTTLVFLSLLTVVWISRLLLAKKEAIAIRVDAGSRWFFPLLFLLMLTFSLWL